MDQDVVNKKTFIQKIFAKKLKILIAIIVLAGGGYFVNTRFFMEQSPQYEYITATRGAIVEEITETGTVRSPEDLDLYFESSGRVKNVFVDEGDVVARGQVLMALDGAQLIIQEREAVASLASAQARYAQALAGATPEEIRIYETAVRNAERNLEEARASATESINLVEAEANSAEIARNNSATNLTNVRNSTATTLNNLYETARITTRSNIVVMSSALTHIDNILGIDNATANDSFEINLGVLNPQTETDAVDAYREAKSAYNTAFLQAGNLLAAVPQSVIDTTIPIVRNALNKVIFALEKTKLLLNSTITDINLTPTELNTQKTTIDTDRTSATSAISSLDTAEQNIIAAKATNQTNIHAAETTLISAESSLTAARAKLSSTQASTQVTVVTSEGNLRTAEDQLASKRAPLREVDRAVYEASVRGAQATLDLVREQIENTRIKAPIDGVITTVDLKTGELATTVVRAMTMISEQLEIEVDVSELDIAKISIDMSVKATFDALGLEIFTGKVLKIAPREHLKDEDIFYKVTTALDDEGAPLRSGMTADMTILVGERQDALIIPSRLIIRRVNKKFVQALRDGAISEVGVQTGLEGIDTIEILSGLFDGDRVVVWERE